MTTFNRWIKTFERTNNYLGDLARALSLDKFKPRSNSLNAWVEHLVATGANSIVIEHLNEAWSFYENGDGPDSDDDQYRLSLKDSTWTIKRPTLPSYWIHGPTAVLVRLKRPSTKNNDTDCKKGGEGFYVLTVTNKGFAKAVGRYAAYFRHEFRYDFLPYTVHEHEKDGDNIWHPYLFFSKDEPKDVVARPVGACGLFLWPEHKVWEMNWAWMHPMARRKGHLSKHWAYFSENYGDFRLSRPLSYAMTKFVDRMSAKGK